MIPAAILALVALGALMAVVLVVRSVVIVPKDMAFVIERFGRFGGVLLQGLHLVPPVISTIRTRIPLGEQTVDVAPAACTTRDGAAATCAGSVTFRVIDPAVAASAVENHRDAVARVVAHAWSEAIAASEAAGAPLAVRGAHARAATAAAAWGITIVDARPLLTLSGDAMRGLEARAGTERDARVAAWARERRQPLAADGRPTEAQHAAYDEWMALEVRAHQRDIEAARRDAGGSPAAVPPAFAPGAAAPAMQFAVARVTIAPGELGVVEAGGRDWAARNLSATEIARGFRCAVERQEDETLFVRAI